MDSLKETQIGSPGGRPEESSSTGEMLSLIDNMDPRIPEAFRQQAITAARYINTLDNGTGLDNPEIYKFVYRLAHSGFIQRVFLKSEIPFLRNKGAADPKIALPAWLQKDFLVQNGIYKRDDSLSKEEEKSIEKMFSSWVTSVGYGYEDRQSGRYYILDEPTRDYTPTHKYKYYIENKDLLAALRENRLSSLIEDLILQQTELYDLKLFEEDRLVFYFRQDINEAEETERILKSHNINFRGPAQDVYELIITPNGTLDRKVFISNDQSLGAGGRNPRDYKLTEYTPQDFLADYLDMCLYGGKRPDSLYLTSFVYLIDREGVAQGKEQELASKGSEIVNYPVVYARRRLDISIVRKNIPTSEVKT